MDAIWAQHHQLNHHQTNQRSTINRPANSHTPNTGHLNSYEGRAFRIETVINKPSDIGVLARLEHLPELIQKARDVNHICL